jgi:hypothetical protein
LRVLIAGVSLDKELIQGAYHLWKTLKEAENSAELLKYNKELGEAIGKLDDLSILLETLQSYTSREFEELGGKSIRGFFVDKYYLALFSGVNEEEAYRYAYRAIEKATGRKGEAWNTFMKAEGSAETIEGLCKHNAESLANALNSLSSSKTEQWDPEWVETWIWDPAEGYPQTDVMNPPPSSLTP